MNYLVIDCETTTFSKGNPYSQQNKLCLVGIRGENGYEICFDIEYSDHNYKTKLNAIQDLIQYTNLLVLFNAKFDLAWLRRYGIDYSHCRVFDCQLAHFILSGQQQSYPSLNGVADHWGLGTKLDTIKEDYWDKGLDTPNIPLPLLTEYLVQDLALTEQVYLKQIEHIATLPLATQRLISLSNQDLLVLLEMEYNGIKMDFESMQKASQVITQQINLIKGELNDILSDIPSCFHNYSSNDCLSAILYGGKLTETIRTVVGVYKTGPKTGQDRYKITYVEHLLPRKITPTRGSELKKEGFFATNEETLRSLKTSKEHRILLDKILELSKLEKLNGTYYLGLATLHFTKDWEPGYIHGQFNQCVARTGRLSSSSPNLQNFPEEIDQFIVTRF